MNPLCARDASVAGRKNNFAFVPRKITLCRTNAHSAVSAVRLALLVQDDDPITKNVGARVLEAHFRHTGWLRESHPMRLV